MMRLQLPDNSGYGTHPEGTTNETQPVSYSGRSVDTDIAVVEELRKGNADVMLSLFKLFYAPLCYFAERILHDRPASQDIVEDSFMKLWKKHTDFSSLQNIKAFLYITTRNAALNHLKQHQRNTASIRELAYLRGEADDHVLNSIVRAEVIAEIYQQIERLPTQSKKVLKMSIFQNMRNHEIARALDVSVHTVKNQKVRAVQILRMNIGKLNNHA